MSPQHAVVFSASLRALQCSALLAELRTSAEAHCSRSNERPVQKTRWVRRELIKSPLSRRIWGSAGVSAPSWRRWSPWYALPLLSFYLSILRNRCQVFSETESKPGILQHRLFWPPVCLTLIVRWESMRPRRAAASFINISLCRCIFAMICARVHLFAVILLSRLSWYSNNFVKAKSM